jgi:hypothetical protein
MFSHTNVIAIVQWGDENREQLFVMRFGLGTRANLEVLLKVAVLRQDNF